MADIYGTVVRLTSNKGVSSRTGKPYTTHGAVVQTTSGEEMDVDFGFSRPAVEQGGFYKLTVEKNYGKWGVKSVEAASENSAPKNNAAPPVSGRNPGKVFPVPVDHPDRSIIRQNALAHATRVVLDADFVSADYDANAVAELIVKTAYIFEDYATGDREERVLSEELSDGKA